MTGEKKKKRPNTIQCSLMFVRLIKAKSFKTTRKKRTNTIQQHRKNVNVQHCNWKQGTLFLQALFSIQKYSHIDSNKVKAIPWWSLHRPNQKQVRNQTRQYSLDQVLKHQGMKICQILLETQTIQVDSKYAKWWQYPALNSGPQKTKKHCIHP